MHNSLRAKVQTIHSQFEPQLDYGGYQISKDLAYFNLKKILAL